MKRRKRRHLEGDVELNVTAMLDMAFQLLAFFILTYQPSPVEACIAVRMPPPAPISKPTSSNDGGTTSPENADAIAGAALTLPITVKANKKGSIASISIAERLPTANIREFERQLRALMRESKSTYDQVLIKASPTLEYENVLRVVEICARNRLTSGEQTKLNIVELQ